LATAAPAVRARAARLGVDLATISGSGPEGRVVHEDLDGLLAKQAPAPAPLQRDNGDEVEDVKVVGLRRNIAERMQASKRRIPHFTYVEEVDVTALEELRGELNDGDRPRLSVLPFLMRAVVVAIRDHPEMNARFDDEAGVVKRHRAVHLGIAVQTPRGLMVPVVKDADVRDLWSSAAEVARLSDAARTAKVTLEELSGSTITITSLGALGGIVTTPVINAPEVAIIGVNKIATRPVFRDGAFVPRQIMNLSSSFDHRVVDGADAAAFIQRIRALLEQPALLFMS
jgi:2-oxoisovalerate dehydrogenase E2 component (dihydrolipoyl transacylase)